MADLEFYSRDNLKLLFSILIVNLIHISQFGIGL